MSKDFRAAALMLAAVMLMLSAPGAGAAAGKPKYAGIVVDANTGKVLHEAQADAPRYPASLTKMMTLYLVFEDMKRGRLTYESRIVMSATAAAAAPSKLGLDPGESLTLMDAIKALITKSANDVAIALAEKVAGSESRFARLMTERARQIGMRATTFRNASGLPDPGQITTARDMITLALRLYDDFPEQYRLFSLRSFTFRGKTYRTHNTLMHSFEGMDGIKTGYTRASGFNVVTSVRRSGLHLVGAVFGGSSAASRNSQMRFLLRRALVDASREKTRKAKPALVATPAPAKRPADKSRALEERIAGTAETLPWQSPSATPNSAKTQLAAASAKPAKAPATSAPATPAPAAPAHATQSPASSATGAKPVPAPAADAGLPPRPLPLAPEPIVQIVSVKPVLVPLQPAPVEAPALEKGELAASPPGSMTAAGLSPERGGEAPSPAGATSSLRAPAPTSPPGDRETIAVKLSHMAPEGARAPSTLDRQLALLNTAPPAQPSSHFDAQPAPAPAAARPPSTLQQQAALLRNTRDAWAGGNGAQPRFAAAGRALEPQWHLRGPVAESAGASAGLYEVEIGVFPTAEEAERRLEAAKSATPMLAAHSALALPLETGKKRLVYRARFTGLDQTRAGAACNELRRRGIDCRVAAPQ